jgi:hypothetical protein
MQREKAAAWLLRRLAAAATTPGGGSPSGPGNIAPTTSTSSAPSIGTNNKFLRNVNFRFNQKIYCIYLAYQPRTSMLSCCWSHELHYFNYN